MKNLEPKKIWEHFYSLTQIPRPSGHKEAISKFVADFGKQLNLPTEVDEIGNVIIRKPASAGYESHPGVILQAHLDMVPQKDDNLAFDFTKDPIQTVVEGEWVTAKGTTLGADDGMGVAMIMAVLEDNTLQHPAIEALFTVDEETGMYGAFDLKAGALKGQVMINLDSEQEGEFIIGCAGGVDAVATFDFQPKEVTGDVVAFQLSVEGCKGGHSGVDIHLQRANANKLLFRLLKMLVRDNLARLSSVQGGDMRNALPRSSMAIFTVPKSEQKDIEKVVASFEKLVQTEYKGVEDGLKISVKEVAKPKNWLPEETQDWLIHAITACPHGVYRFIQNQPQTVETSDNIGIIATKENQIEVACLLRSTSESRKKELREIVDSVFALAGAKVEFSGDYPGWQPNFDSRVTKVVQETYKEEFNKEGEIKVIHAGLECGIINRYYDLDICSIGPTILHPHSPSEKVNIASVQHCYQLLKAVLKKL